MLPEVTRLNRNVLLVAAMGVAVIILAVTHVVRSNSRAAPRAAETRVEAGAVGSFLNDPPNDERTLVPPPAYPDSPGSDAPIANSSTSPAYGAPIYEAQAYV